MTSPIWRSWPSTFSPSGSVTSKSPSPLPGSSLAAISVGFSTGSPSANRFCPRPLPRDWCEASTKLRMGPLSSSLVVDDLRGVLLQVRNQLSQRLHPASRNPAQVRQRFRKATMPHKPEYSLFYLLALCL